jgi:hypothetical protein
MLLDSKLLVRQPVINLHLEIQMTDYNSEWLNNLDLPRDRHTLNAWARSFFALDPDIHRIITQHALLLSKYYQLDNCENQNANDFLGQMLHDLHIQSFLKQILTEYFVLGEVFIYAELDESKGKWNRLIIQNPDYIVVKRTAVDNEQETKYYLRPDENLRRMIFSDKEEDIKNCRKLSPSIIACIKNRENIPLDNFYLFSMMNKVSPYEVRGTSFLCPLFPLLKKNERTEQDTQIIRETLFDVLVLNNEIRKDIVMQRYLLILDGIEYWLNQKILAPIAKINGFTQTTSDKKELCFPKVQFDRIKLRKEINKIK